MNSLFFLPPNFSFKTQRYLILQMLQLAEYHESALVSVKTPKKLSIKERKKKLLAFLQGINIAILCTCLNKKIPAIKCVC